MLELYNQINKYRTYASFCNTHFTIHNCIHEVSCVDDVYSKFYICDDFDRFAISEFMFNKFFVFFPKIDFNLNDILTLVIKERDIKLNKIC